MAKKQHGGGRPGSGRKPKEKSSRDGKVAMTIHVSPDIKERFNGLCEARGQTQEETFTYFVRAVTR